ncbi:uncharacterized protein LOC129917967 [Episyrphus balteatus]|uniref:uncharacterized protein LOC129917967 n=1 Tax=Episyrphus balteatus TaxID=286459 RepID=UPI00248609A4|nr:uncharacterized protein LOC129917967 [Episyrphus balteatus]
METVASSSTQRQSDVSQLLARNESTNRIIQDILQRQKSFKDDPERSIHPSYTDFKVPYHMTCRLRYCKKMNEYEKQFQRELNEMLNHQPTAYDAARFNRHLCITTLWRPLHNRKEIDYFQRNFFRMNPRQKKRLEFIMNTKMI